MFLLAVGFLTGQGPIVGDEKSILTGQVLNQR